MTIAATLFTIGYQGRTQDERPVAVCSAFEGRGDRVDGQEHWQRLAVQKAFTDALDGDEAEALIEAHGFGLGVADDGGRSF
ncbi:MAG TPA: hypothetical protein VI072_20005 [Polyangiaceae bacterium]